MRYGIVIYNQEDYKKNQWFIEQMITYGKKYNLVIQCVLTKDITLVIENGESIILIDNKIQPIDFVINRSRLHHITLHLEMMNIPVFNNYEVCLLGNDKMLAHQRMNTLGIRSVNTYLEHLKSFNISKYKHYPYIVKSIDGHGGNEVYMVENEMMFSSILNLLSNSFIIQSLAGTLGQDLRVYVLGNKIYKGCKRVQENNFKSNYSLGGKVELYSFREQDIKIIEDILSHTSFDFCGIDFLFDEDGELLFNEIEDAVGCRMLYEHNIDVLEDFILYLNNKIQINTYSTIVY